MIIRRSTAPHSPQLTYSWISEAPEFPQVPAKIRYRQEDQACTVNFKDNELTVEFDQPQRAVTPRQAIVFYQGPRCLGGALIKP